MDKIFTRHRFVNVVLTALFMMAGASLLAQAVPEMIYYKFDVAGASVQNQASAPVGLNPAPVLGLTMGGTGQFGLALIGNGGASSTNYVNTGWATSLPSTGWTISMWLANQPSNTSLYYLWGDPGAASFRCFIGGAAGAGNILLRGGGLTDVVVSGVAPGCVVHFVYTGSAIRYFKNGVFIAQVSQPAITITGAGPFKVGGYSTSIGMVAGSLMDEFRMYNRALSDGEVSSTWNVSLGAGATLTGTVTSAQTGLPIAGAVVTIPPTFSGTTIANGTYTMTAPVGLQNVTCTAAGYYTQVQQKTIVANQTNTLDFQMVPIPAILAGVVTNAANGNPIVGAKFTVANPPANTTAYSVAGGAYAVTIAGGGTYNVTCSKTGFDDFNLGPIVFVPNSTVTVNVAMLENVNAPANVTAVLNTAQTASNISWGIPDGDYELLYDDGIPENFTVWAVAGNENAVKFTPAGYPATVYGGKVNIGTPANYPPGSSPLVPFQMAVFDASGPGGLPGVAFDTVDVIPADYGWVDFTLNPITITSGSFYLVMIQGGNAPDAAGIAVDETIPPELRSFARFVTGSGPWIPAGGDFLMRALVNGPGGPIPIDGSGNPVAEETGSTDNSDAITGYQVWRLKQGEEATPGVWTSIGAPTATNISDNSWPSLPCGPYLWAVEAIYTGNRFSPPAFSNVIGKCWTAEVTVNVTLTCAASPEEGTIVKLVNNAYPDTMYVAMTDTNGTVMFPTVWKGNYTLSATRFTYPLYSQVLDIMGDMTIDINMLQDKTPPTDLFVDDHSLEAIWNSPRSAVQMFAETWASGNFTANQWVESPANSNWQMNTGFGNPAPSATFYWSPTLTNYHQYLTSKNFTGIYAPQQLLKYDIYLSNFSTATEEFLAVELWDGATWHVLKTYSNQNGNISWTSEALDISAYNDITFKIRFHAYGPNSFNINNWNIDNIYILATDGSTGYNPCVIGYNFYLNTVLVAFTTDTTYLIPPNLVQYGQTYNACVNAVYGSGYSAQDCYTFTSHFLYPPQNLEVEGVECNAYLTWEKPAMVADYIVTDVKPRTSMPDPSIEYSPMEVTLANVDYSDAIWDILFSWNGTDAARPGIEADNDYVYLSAWQSGFGAPPWFQKYNKTTGVLVESFDIPGATAVRDMAYDGQYFYGSAASTSLFKMDFATHTLVATIPTGASSGIRHCAYDPDLDGGNGGFWCGNWSDMKAISMTGTLLWNGPTMVNAYGSAYDNQSSGGPFLWVFSQTSSGLDAEILQYAISYTPLGLTPTGVIFDVQTVPGAAGGSAGGLCASSVATKYALIADVQLDPQFVVGLEVADYSGPGGTPDGLIGYNVYRDGAFIAYVSGPDTTWYYDLNLDPDTYEYAVTAYYDLTDYGFPGQFDESLIEGPESINITCGRPLPFFEPWDQASFSYNNWSFSPVQGNWSMNSALGNPAPTADFSWQPMLYNYEYALESPVLNAGPWTCASLWFDFDYKLEDRNATGEELLSVEVFYNGTWHQKAEYANNGSIDWTSEHFDISSAQGKALKVRFVALGEASEDILHWYVDNIHVYGICNPPVDLTGSASLNNVTLTWVPPTCEGGGGGGTVMQFIFDDGTAENGWAINPGWTAWIGNEFPIAPTYQGVIQSFDVFFYYTPPGPDMLTIDIFDATQTVVGTSDPFTTPDNTWGTVLVNDVPFAGMFYGMVKWDMIGSASNYLGIDENGPFSADDYEWYYDGTTWDKFSNMGYNAGVMLVRATALVGGDLKTVDLVAGQKPTGHITTTGALSQSNSYFDTKNYATSGVVDNNADSSQIIGYNVYRQDPGAIDYLKVNNSLITATSWSETVPDYGTYCYYVTSNFNDSQSNQFLCESPSDTICVDVWIGVPQLDKDKLMIYPNPATGVVNVKSEAMISTIEVMNFVGQAVYTVNAVDSKTAKVNVTTLGSGVYFVKVTTAEGVRTAKITVTH